MDNHILAICGAAALVAFIHVIAGPDHYIPFIVLAKANKWSAKRTALISIFCGVGHILSSVVVGLIAVAIGISLGALEHIESIRGGSRSLFTYRLWFSLCHMGDTLCHQK